MSNYPKDWKHLKVSDCLEEFVNGYAFNAKKYSPERDYPILRMSNIGLGGKFQYNPETSKYCSPEEYESLSNFHVKYGDLIMAMTDVTPGKELIGASTIVNKDRPFVLNQRVGLLRLKQNIALKEFFTFWSNGDDFKQYAKENSGASAQANLGTSDIKSAPIVLPTLNEQKKIAEILSSVDKVIELTEIEIEKLKNLKKGMMQDLLTKGIGHTKFKESPIGRIPESWDCLKLSEISKLTVGVVCNATDHYVEEGGVPFVRSQNVRPDKINLDKLSFISEEFNQSQKKSILEEGDVMVVRTGYPGTAAVVTPELVGGNCFSLVLIKPKREVVLSQYLSIIINSDLVKNQIENMQFGSAQANFNIGEASNLNIPLPTFNEQELLVSYLKSVSTNINNKMQKLEKLKDIKKGLMQDLLTGKARVKV